MYTTRPDTLFGATYMVLAPEHPLVRRITTKDQRDAVSAYVEAAIHKSELERTAAEEGDLLRQYYLEEIANLALEQAANWLTNYLEERFGVGDLSSLSPGSLDDWPITEQTKLFSIFGNTERLIGVPFRVSMKS